MKKYVLALLSTLPLLLLSTISFAEQSTPKASIPSAQRILFGQTAAIGGPASALGVGMRDGILAAFKEQNDKGGVKGFTLDLLTLDDGYEPEQAVINTKKLINNKDVFALIGGVGTPTANAIEPITSQAKVPFIAPFTGAQFLREPYKRYVVNTRASYWQETEEWVAYAVDKLGYSKFSILYQDDTYGRAGLSGVERALKKRGLTLLSEGTYKRNTTAVKMALFNIMNTDPEMVFMVGAYKPCAAFIKLAKQRKINAKFINISFVGTKAIIEELENQGEGVIISQVVPFPFDDTNPLIQTYKKALESHGCTDKIGFVSLEGYIAGRLVIDVLKNMDLKNLTREGFLDALIDIKNFDINGLNLTFGKGDNQGSNSVFLTRIDGQGKIQPLKS
tara:strand:- start:887 stop:2059 length:1173 start_codon:yes stop_codon:yes gene_type:complete